jgi:hypothetical protein
MVSGIDDAYQQMSDVYRVRDAKLAEFEHKAQAEYDRRLILWNRVCLCIGAVVVCAIVVGIYYAARYS